MAFQTAGLFPKKTGTTHHPPLQTLLGIANERLDENFARTRRLWTLLREADGGGEGLDGLSRFGDRFFCFGCCFMFSSEVFFGSLLLMLFCFFLGFDSIAMLTGFDDSFRA